MYTYRCGQKVPLEKNPNQLVVRSLPKDLKDISTADHEQVSSASTRITVARDKLEATMANFRGVAPTHHAYHLEATGEEFLITDRIFVRFKKEQTLDDVNRFMTKYNLVFSKKYSDKDYLFQLTNSTGMNPVKLVVLLTEKDKEVKLAGHDLNKRVQKYQPVIPTDPFYLKQWHLHDKLNHPDFDPISSSRCEEAWQLLGNFGDPNIVVAVTDDGCRLDHADFNDTNKFRSWGYFQGQTLLNHGDIHAQPADMYESGSNHGTSCAGVIAGEADAVKTVGAAPGCTLLPIKWESSGSSLFISDSKLMTALRHIADKADIMSNSWGSSPSSNYELQVLDLIKELSISGGPRGKGIVFLWAAGNENCPIEHDSNIDIPFEHGYQQINGSWHWVGPRTSRHFSHNLTQLPGVMYVAALASTGQRSHYSNYGTGIGICAPSSNSHAYFRLQLAGLGITTATGEGTGVRDDFGGTSSATPLVAGVAALILSANSNLKASDVIRILKTTASKNLNFRVYPRTPPSAVDPNTSWDVSPAPPFDDGAFVDFNLPEGTWSPWFGHGKVDANAAVSAAIAARRQPSGSKFTKTANPNIDIPDFDTIGISDTIHCDKTGKLTSIEVDLDISHTYIGDLEIIVRSPFGTTIPLHIRNGGSTNDLKKTFSTADTPALGNLAGEEVTGDWKLSVKDMASIDTGRLNSWKLKLVFTKTKQEVIEEAPGVNIPDNNQGGIERTLAVQSSGRIKNIEVSVDITHSWIGDLSVSLVSPRSGSFSLQDRKGGSNDNLIKTFTEIDTPQLQGLIGKSIKGNWKLKVSDHANADTGKLNQWKVVFKLD